MNGKTHLTSVARRANRKKLLDKLIEFGRLLERFSSEDRTMKNRVVTANAELKDFNRRMFHDREMKRHLQREKRDAAIYRKKIATQISQLRSRIRLTQRQLEGS
jgi:DNA repair ATPase RecN